MYQIPVFGDSRSVIQNDFVERIWQAFGSTNVVALEAPAGFGKTFISLALAKNFVRESGQKVLIATAATNHTVNFWRDHLKQEALAQSDVDLSFLIGKGNPSFKPCFYLDEWLGKKPEDKPVADNVYSLCELKREMNDCQHYSNLFEFDLGGEKVLTEAGATACKKTKVELSNLEKELGNEDLVRIIGKLKSDTLCPYYVFKQNFSKASVQVCDFQYLIQPGYLEKSTKDFLLVIDEFDKFEERLREQFKIDLSLNQLQNVLTDLNTRQREVFRQAFADVEPEKRRVFLQSFSTYASMLIDFFASVSNGLELNQPRGIELEEAFFGVAFYKEAHERFKAFFKNNRESLLKVLNNPFLKKNPYRHIIAFFSHLESSLQQKEAISFVDSVTKKERQLGPADVVVVRKPLIFLDFYLSLCKRFDKVLIMSATLPFKEMLDVGFGQSVEWLQVPKALGLTGKKQGIILNSPFFDFSNKHRKENLSVKVQMLGDLIEELSQVRPEVVVFFNAYASLAPCKVDLFSLLEKRGFSVFLDEERKQDANHNRDVYWEKFKSTPGKKVLFSTMYTKYARGSNILKDNGCRILLLVGIPYPHVLDFELKKFDELAKKHKWRINAATWHYVFTTRKNFMQAIGRLTRHKADFGYFVVLSNDSINRILDFAHRDLLDIQTETPFVRQVTDSAKAFFGSIGRSE